MKISYLVACHNETNTLSNLLSKLAVSVCNKDEIVILDDFSDNKETIEILNSFRSFSNFKFYQHHLSNNYGEHKNWGTEKCDGNWVFQIDGDELPPDNLLGENLEIIIESNPNVELIYVPRINDQRGVTEEDAKEFGWRLVYLPQYENGKIPLVSWPDYQSRIYKRVPDRIKWVNKLHEKIEGYTQYSILPAELEYALYHDKSIEKTRETNRRYNQQFTIKENLGHKLI